MIYMQTQSRAVRVSGCIQLSKKIDKFCGDTRFHLLSPRILGDCMCDVHGNTVSFVRLSGSMQISENFEVLRWYKEVHFCSPRFPGGGLCGIHGNKGSSRSR